MVSKLSDLPRSSASSVETPVPSSSGAWFRRLLVFGAAAALATWAARDQLDPKQGRDGALASVLAERGLQASGPDVVWLERPDGVAQSLAGSARALVRASSEKGEPADIYLVEAKLSPEGVLLDVGSVYPLTQTSGADEQRPIVSGDHAAFVARGLSFEPGDGSAGEAAAWVHVLDFSAGLTPGDDWTSLERAQLAVASYQETGQLRGIARRSFAVDPPPRQLALHFAANSLSIRADERSAEVPLGAIDENALPPWLRLEPSELAHPGNLVTWSVDRVRAIPWIGDDAMQTVKAVAFTALDFVLRNKEAVTGDTGEDSIAEDLGQTGLDAPKRETPVDPEIGFPPAALEPWVTPPLAGEGQWNDLSGDPFLRQADGLPSTFFTTFIRSDRSRKATRVYVAIWDPRTVELHMMAGTVEPKGATGEAGPGTIPRSPEIMRRVVGASNAGFQALHGEFGMMADGVVYLPPKPYAATVGVLRDGTTAFGTWPESQAIPDTLVSYRQNMTVMVQDEKFNPYGRNWWGGTPPGWADKTHTVRTGICLTKERFVAYFYGADISPDALAQAMIQTRCSYGIALDMNAGHSGLELYKVDTADELGSLGRPLHTDWEAEGEISGLDGFRFRGRRFIRGMGLMNFPRYIRPEARDFFYMTLRPLLPGRPVALGREPAFEGEGVLHVKGLPQHGYPYALASGEIGFGGGRARILALDPRLLKTQPVSAPAGATVAIVDAGVADPGDSLWHSAGAFSVGPTPPVADAVRLVSTPSAHPTLAAGALGVRDDDGMLLYAEPPAPVAPAELEALMKLLGCSTKLLLATPWDLALGGDTNLAGQAVHPPGGPSAVRLARAAGPSAGRMFEDTPVVPFDVWYTLQQKRVRYFKKREDATPTAAPDQ